MPTGTLALRVGCAAVLYAAGTFALLNPAMAAPVQDRADTIGGGLGLEQPVPQTLNPDGSIPNQYIVTLDTAALGSTLQTLGLEATIKNLLSLVGGGKVLSIYDTALTGFAVEMPAAQVSLLKRLPQVADVEPNRMAEASTVQINPINWGLDRIDQTDLPLDGKFGYPYWQGQGAQIYILDSGINPHHSEFEGRISADPNQHVWVKSIASNPWDCNGHGTFVASVAAGTQLGVAKRATVHSIRVLGCDGRGPTNGIIAGIDWLARNARQPAVANLSLGGSPASAAINRAVRALVNANVAVAVAAGNENQSACNVSPASEPSVVTVAGVSKDDYRGYYSNGTGFYSNWGSCVDLFAPGTDIAGADQNNVQGYVVGTGTSAASPFVAGALAIWRAKWPTEFNARQQQDGLIHGNTTPNRVGGISQTPNRLLYIDQAPKASFSFNCTLFDCAFNGTASTDERAISAYAWDFGDGTTATGANVAHTYSGPGLYQVTLTVTDDTSHPGTTTREVLIPQP